MTKTNRLAFIAILGALSFVLMFLSFPIIGVDFLKVELSVLPVLVAVLHIDLKAGYQVLLLRTVLKLLLNNRGVNDYIGLPMNILALGIFVTCFAILYKKRQSLAALLTAGAVGTISLTAAMMLLNLVYAIPLYAKFANFDISTAFGTSNYLLTMVLPFNLLQGLIFTIAFALILVPLRRLLK